MSILTETYEHDIDIGVIVWDSESTFSFIESCEPYWNKKWSAEAQITAHLADGIAKRINAKIMAKIMKGTRGTIEHPSGGSSHYGNRITKTNPT